jgi:hypothetical protein
MRNKRKSILKVLTLMVLFTLGFGAVSVHAGKAGIIFQDTIAKLGLKADNPSPTCASGFWFNAKTGKCDVKPTCASGTAYNQSTNMCDAAPATVCTTAGNVKTCVSSPQATVGGKTVNAQSIASGEVIFAAEMHIKGVVVSTKNCFWTKPGQPWQNGYNTVGGVTYHNETTPARLCHWHHKLVKVAGGETGRACFNLAKLGPGPKQQNVTIVIVNSFNITIPLKAQVSVAIQDTCGHAEASATASGKMTLSKFIHAKGHVSVDVFETTIVDLKTAVGAGINCAPPVTTTQTSTTTQTVTQPVTVTQPTTTTATTTVPSTTTQTVPVTTTQTVTTTTTATTPSHFTNLTCQGQEEVTGGGSSVLVCKVSNDNGAEIALNVQVTSNSGNLLVSGIQCTSQGGTPTCMGSGTYEVRLKGVNNNADRTPVFANLEATASSNGVRSDTFRQTFQVDSSCSNFDC